MRKIMKILSHYILLITGLFLSVTLSTVFVSIIIIGGGISSLLLNVKFTVAYLIIWLIGIVLIVISSFIKIES